MRAMILAAGFGERMRPLTQHTPKPLLPLNGTPIIDYHLRKLAQCGVQDVLINYSWLGEQILAHVGDGSRYGLRVQYSPEAEPLETLGGIMQALDKLGEQFMVVNGDIYCEYNFAQLKLSDDKNAHLILVNNPAHHPQGDFALSDGRCRDQAEHRLTFSGMALYRREFFAQVKQGKAPLAPLLRAQIAQGAVSGEHYLGYWSDIGTVQRLHECEHYLQQREA